MMSKSEILQCSWLTGKFTLKVNNILRLEREITLLLSFRLTPMIHISISENDEGRDICLSVEYFPTFFSFSGLFVQVVYIF